MPDQKPNLPPPGGDEKKAQHYVDTLTSLISNDKVSVTQTDLSRFNSVSMEDHYRIDLHDYDAELSHNKNPDTGEETFVMIFNSINKFDMGSPKPIILAYMRLTSDQFMNIKQVSDEQIERTRKRAEEERFNDTMAPVDHLLNQLSGGSPSVSEDDKTIDRALEMMDQDETKLLSDEAPKKGFDSMPSISEYSQPEETPQLASTPTSDAPPIPDPSWD